MSEQTMRGRVVEALRPLDAVSIENGVGVGTPDVNYAEGWIELKWVRSWPKRPDTPVVLEHFTREQRRWIDRRSRAGGKVFVLLKVGRDWFLFRGMDAARQLGELPRAGLEALALRRWSGGLNDAELIEVLR